MVSKGVNSGNVDNRLSLTATDMPAASKVLNRLHLDATVIKHVSS